MESQALALCLPFPHRALVQKRTRLIRCFDYFGLWKKAGDSPSRVDPDSLLDFAEEEADEGTDDEELSDDDDYEHCADGLCVEERCSVG